MMHGLPRNEWLAEQVRRMEKEIENLKVYHAYLLGELEKEDYELYVEYILEKEMRLKK